MRLFIAADPPRAIADKIAVVQRTLADTKAAVRWVDPADYHVTVKFLGEVADGDVVEVSEAMKNAAENLEPFAMRTGECGCFPERGSVRIVWTSVVEDGGRLAGCVAAVEAQIEPLGFPREHRPFAAHVTIGRVREDRSQGKLRERVQAHSGKIVEQDVSSLTLMSSALSPKGSTYTVVSRAKLGAK